MDSTDITRRTKVRRTAIFISEWFIEVGYFLDLRAKKLLSKTVIGRKLLNETVIGHFLATSLRIVGFGEGEGRAASVFASLFLGRVQVGLSF